DIRSSAGETPLLRRGYIWRGAHSDDRLHAPEPALLRDHARPVCRYAAVPGFEVAAATEPERHAARDPDELLLPPVSAGPNPGIKVRQSEELFSRAQRSIPGGVNSPVRAFRSVGGTPRFIARGQGSHLFDVDGNDYIDYICSWGPLILGHRPPEVIEAIQSVLDLGTSFGAPTGLETQLAELIIDAVPSVEMVRLVNSGTEATMSALRVARGFTGRDLTVKFEGCYHGHVDSLLVKAGSGIATLGIPDTAGVPKAFADTTIALPFNDLEQVESAFRAEGDKIAAVIIEPVVGNMGCVLPKPGFLEGLRRITQQYGTVLIFDEVMTGFRLSRGGAQQLYGVTPDMTTLGKIIGGGLPMAAYGGRAEIMKHVAPLGHIYQAGTLSGNPVAVTAGIAVLRYLKAHPE